MAFNITNLVNAINAKSATVGADSALDKAVLLASNVKNALIYSSSGDLPTADSSNQGDLVRIGSSFGADTKYYVSHRDRWNLIGLDDSDVVTEGQFPGFQGSNYGYNTGGSNGSSSSNVIEKFPFASDFNGTATDVGDLTEGRYNAAGQSSAAHGYNSGGTPTSNVINKFPFAAGGNATDVGDLTVARFKIAGQSSIVNGFGYTTGDYFPSTPNNVIDKFPFSSSFTTATDVGDLTIGRYGLSGQSSTTDGYASGGIPTYNTIDKFSFTTDGNATDVGDLSSGRQSLTGQSSTTHGYSSGGFSNIRVDIIDKFPFTSNGNATDVGDLTVGKNANSGQSSTAHGYSSGGYDTGASNIIEKFPFASDDNATDAGDLSVAKYSQSGQQY
jgi:hypothetical protein